MYRVDCSALPFVDSKIRGLRDWVLHTSAINLRRARAKPEELLARLGIGHGGVALINDRCLSDVKRSIKAAEYLDWDDVVTYANEVAGFGMARLRVLFCAATGQALPPVLEAAIKLLSAAFHVGLRQPAAGARGTTGHTVIDRATLVALHGPESAVPLDSVLAVLTASVVPVGSDVWAEYYAAVGECGLRSLLNDAVRPIAAGVGPLLDGRLNEGQRAAVRGVLGCKSRVMVLSGAAGTGKTRTLAALCSAISAVPTVVLAPTGAAAQRACVALGPDVVAGLAAPVSTVHLFIAKRRSRKGRKRVVLCVVDEASMIDSATLGQLLAVLGAAATTRFLFVGDPHQLPPVGPGCVFHDLIEQQMCPHFALTEVMRTSDGGLLEAFAHVRARMDVGDYLPDPHDLFVDYRPRLGAALVRQLVDLFAADRRWFVHTTVVSHRNSVVDYVNAICAQVVRAGGEGVPEEPPGIVDPLAARQRGGGEDVDWRFEGAKVVFTKNDAALGVVNGSVGFVQRGDDVKLVDDGAAVRVPRDYLHIRLGFALTVHKSQGSEYDHCVYVHIGDTETLPLLYTAITRSRERLTILCPGNVVVSRRETPRQTMLSTGASSSCKCQKTD